MTVARQGTGPAEPVGHAAIVFITRRKRAAAEYIKLDGNEKGRTTQVRPFSLIRRSRFSDCRFRFCFCSDCR